MLRGELSRMISGQYVLPTYVYVCVNTGAHNDVRSGKEEERATTTQKIKF